MRKRSWFLAVMCMCGIVSIASAEDWPQWRGPERNGISKETGLLQDWPKEGPKLLWQINDAGGGYSTPAVVGDRLYDISNKGKDNELVHARSVEDGKPVWSTRLGKVGPNFLQQYPGARSTPTIDGDRLYALGSDGDLVCMKLADGAEIWRKNLRTDFGGEPGSWAYAESPLIDGGVLVCAPGGKDASLITLDKMKGTVIWKSAVPGAEKAAYSSIIIVQAGGSKEYATFLGKGLVGVDAKTGKFLWRFDKTATSSPANIPTPIAEGNLVYSSTGKGGGGLVKLMVDNQKVTANPVYVKKDVPTSIGGAVLLGKYLFGTNNNGLLCVEFATGAAKWQDKCVGAGSVCYADGRLYIHGENGQAALVEGTPDGYHEHGRFTPPGAPQDRGKPSPKAWAYPVVANGRLYLRDLDAMWCYDVRAAKATK